jgi:sarcosine oxidase subunit alpha
VDGLAVTGGWNPTVHLTCHHGGRPVWNDALAGFVPGKLPPGLRVAGSANGRFNLADCFAEGAAQSIAALREIGFNPTETTLPQVAAETIAPARPLWRVVGGKGKAFVDFQHDVTEDDVVLAHREGFRSVEHLKRYTTLGMATDQGKTANLNGLAIMADLLGQEIAEIGTTLYRPPYTPVAIGAFAGHHRGKDFRATRLTPSHLWAKDQGAVFVETGQWLRAQYFPQAGEQDWQKSVNREVMAVRSDVGVCDVSTLGKIDIQGADAGIFLDRVYINGFSTLAIGKTRYGVMLREDGIVMDDGTTARLGADHFLMSTTTLNAAKVMQHLEFCHQVLWPSLDVQMVSVTEQWAQFSIAGPRSRALLGRILDPDIDLSNEALPYMGVMAIRVGGVQGRLFRVSFSGELAFELAVPARYGNALMQKLCAEGAVPYGTEALGVMRIEKGHPAGNELNGTTTARDLGMGRMMSTKKDFIGRVMAERPGLCAPDRLTLVGVKPVDPVDRLRAGAHFLPLGAKASAEQDQGYLTSVAFSPSLGHSIGLALIAAGPSRIGEKLRAYDPVRNGDVVVELCNPVFIDPLGERVRG